MVMERKSSRAPLAAAAVAGLLLILFLRSVTGGGGDDDSSSPTTDQTSQPAGDCIPLVVTSSSEKAALLRDMAAAYSASNPRVDGRCVSVTVTSKASGGAADALARGWDDEIDGPRPDVWTPAASSWVVILRQSLAARDAANLVPDDVPQVAQSPLVIAMPRPMAEALGWPQTALGWGDLLALAKDPAGWGKFGHPEWGQFRLGKTNPNFSTSGLNATIGTYFAATGLSNDLTAEDVSNPKTVEFVKAVESTVVHYGDTTLTFLDNLQKADDRGAGLTYVSAVAVEEKSVWDYNMGNPKGDPAQLGQHAKPRVPLAAIYPKEGTLLSDHPFAVLTAPWVTDAKREAAAGFLEYLQERAQQTRFQEAAFRDFEGKPGKVVKATLGMLPDEPKTTLAPPAPAVLDKVRLSWAELRKRARVLLVIDTSGSMGEPVPGSGDTKLELAKAAAVKALDQFAPDDDVGLWIFSSDAGGAKPYLELLPIAPLGPQIDQMRQRITGLVPRGGTALYATTRAAAKLLRDSLDPTRINGVVLLTDGRNEYPPDTDLDGLLRSLRVEDENQLVRVFPIAYGEQADLVTLQKVAEAARAAAYNASDPASINKVFTEVISNF